MKSIKNKLNPYWVTGFVDAEGCFYIRLYRNKDYKIGWAIQACFQIQLHHRDKNLLLLIKSYFNEVGAIYTTRNKNLSIYQVRDLINITTIIIPHFIRYPLITEKYNDFCLFKNIVDLVNKKEHLTQEGLLKIVSLKSSINKGLSESVKKHFSPITITKRHVANIPVKLYPDWIGGFFSGEGCFYFTGKYLRIMITQHYRDELLMNILKNTLECGVISKDSRTNHIILTISKYEDICTKIIPLFDKNDRIKGIKYLNFKDFCLIAKLMDQKLHLSPSGLEKILKIKHNMNKNRHIIRKSCHWQDKISTKYRATALRCSIHLFSVRRLFASFNKIIY